MMAPTSRKRKAANGLDNATKKMCFTKLSTEAEHIDDDSASDYKEDEEDEESNDEETFSEEGSHNVNTPNTPLSPAPGRKKFPSEFKTIRCTWPGCDKAFNRPARLMAHLRSHTNERPFICSYEGCDKAYMDDKHLKSHVKGAHTKEREFQCDWVGCDKTFLTSTRRNRHRATHDGTGKFVCAEYPPCNQTFRKHDTLLRHIRSDHLQLAPYQCTHLDLMTGIVCNAGFDGAAGLRKHRDREHSTPQFFCPQCIQPGIVDMNGNPIALAFTTNAKLQSHFRKEHVECLFCNLKCSSRRELEKHIETQHSGVALEDRKTVPCAFPGCDKTFTKQSNMNHHFSTAHTNKRYICGEIDVSGVDDIFHFDQADACGKEFFAKANVEDHIRTSHLGLSSKINGKRNKDTAPSTRMGKPSALQQLIGTAYSGDGRRTIACIVPACDHMFIRDYDLQQHVRRDHRMTTPDVDTLLSYRATMQIHDDIAGDELADLEAKIMNEVGEMVKQYPIIRGVNEFESPTHFGLDDAMGQPDNDWTSNPASAAHTPFWIGADNGMQSQESLGQWNTEEEEMRRLIDQEALLDNGHELMTAYENAI